MIKKLLPILGITFVDIIGFSMLIPVLPYFVTHFGASPFIVGVLFATFSLAGLIAAPIWGNLSDRLGRKTVLIISQIGATISWAHDGVCAQHRGGFRRADPRRRQRRKHQHHASLRRGRRRAEGSRTRLRFDRCDVRRRHGLRTGGRRPAVFAIWVCRAVSRRSVFAVRHRDAYGLSAARIARETGRGRSRSHEGRVRMSAASRALEHHVPEAGAFALPVRLVFGDRPVSRGAARLFAAPTPTISSPDLRRSTCCATRARRQDLVCGRRSRDVQHRSDLSGGVPSAPFRSSTTSTRSYR